MASSRISVLVVEDDTLIRMMVVDELEQNGFGVLEAENGDEALVVLKSNPEITNVFTDVDMPGSFSGVDLAIAVRTSYPHIAVIVASGYLKVPRSFLPDDVPFFPKPYQMREVVDRIRASNERTSD